MDADFSRRLLSGKARFDARVSEIRPRLFHLPTISLFLLPITLPAFCLLSTDFC